ncbi:alpha/beta hydrolase [Microbacterium galbinum]|uniref:Alpha/beta hydrolase family protein n=1 Tax=Microbacterium galbinum TaxID=2851646 RepID=A0ABY4IPC6_9MICO|nr:alpha/beta hydrolase [Microbacterium galbinum]UPL14642.1 alpha/beta hydrolase family protein [Microbacterium galbinum]
MSLTSPNRGWTLEEIEYDSGSLEGIHRDLETLIDEGGNARIVLRNIDGGLEGRGESIDRVQTESGALASRMNPTILTLERIADVVRAYGEAVAQHAKAANDLIDDIETAHAAKETAAADLDAAELAQRQCTPDDTAQTRNTAEQDVTDAESGLASATSTLDDLWEQWESAYSLWDEAYGAAISGLVRSDGTTLSDSTLSAIDALANADSPAEVAEIWDSLTDAQRAALARTYPEFVGNLEGVPYLDRFLANKAAYDRVIEGGPYGEPLDSQLEQLGREVTDFDGQLLMFHPFEHPQATAAVMYGVRIVDDEGNPVDPMDGITNVNVLVGGMFSSLDDLKAWGASGRNLNKFANEYGEGVGSATIAWYGYDSPNLATEHVMGSATEGAARLSSTLRGLDNEVSSQVTTSVIGHSYGSTTAFLAVGGSPDNLGVDNLIAVGSAGVPDGYHAGWTGDAPMDYSGTQIYASRAPGDVVARYGEHSSFGHGMNPEALPGAVSFESDGGEVPSLGGGTEMAVGTPGHAAHDGGNTVWGWWEAGNGYLSRDSESFRNIANIIATGEPID